MIRRLFLDTHPSRGAVNTRFAPCIPSSFAPCIDDPNGNAEGIEREFSEWEHRGGLAPVNPPPRAASSDDRATPADVTEQSEAHWRRVIRSNSPPTTDFMDSGEPSGPPPQIAFRARAPLTFKTARSPLSGEPPSQRGWAPPGTPGAKALAEATSAVFPSGAGSSGGLSGGSSRGGEPYHSNEDEGPAGPPPSLALATCVRADSVGYPAAPPGGGGGGGAALGVAAGLAAELTAKAVTVAAKAAAAAAPACADDAPPPPPPPPIPQAVRVYLGSSPQMGKPLKSALKSRSSFDGRPGHGGAGGVRKGMSMPNLASMLDADSLDSGGGAGADAAGDGDPPKQLRKRISFDSHKLLTMVKIGALRWFLFRFRFDVFQCPFL